MNKRIAVVGMGQGGMVAGIKLAQFGFSVDIYEKSKVNEVGYCWKDDIRSDIFGLVDLPMPPKEIYCQKNKWLFVSPSGKSDLAVPPCKPMEEISIDRRGLSRYFVDLAIKNGCNVFYEKEINSLIVEASAIKGIVVDGEEKFYDLVIDASGLNSKLRSQIPTIYGIQEKPDKEGVLYAYRGFYSRNPQETTRREGIECTMVIKHLGKNGISWCNLNDEDNVDVLIARLDKLTDEDINIGLEDLRQSNGILSTELLHGQKVEICLRASLANGIANGYVAIGDSAFMTMPLMGSGIESSMKAGFMLSQYILKNKVSNFKIENLWGFWVEYMSAIGADFAFIDVVKRWALSDKLLPSQIDWLFGCGLVAEEDLTLISTATDEKSPINLKYILKKAMILLKKPSLVVKAIRVLCKADKMKKTVKKIPNRYEQNKVSKWIKKYNDRLK